MYLNPLCLQVCKQKRLLNELVENRSYGDNLKP